MTRRPTPGEIDRARDHESGDIWTCSCGGKKSLRLTYESATGRTAKREWVCLSCENARLWALERSEGK